MEHYEISNFSRPGFPCLHNLNTWQMGDWIGLGPSAASQYRSRRFRNVAHLGQWAAGMEAQKPVEEDRMDLTPWIVLQDSLLFGLRMRRGIHLGSLRSRHGEDLSRFFPLLAELVDRNLGEQRGEWFSLTDRGLLLSDAIALEILSTEQGEP
jgi:oxygen-independent coproporphyrinogen-3 oxidase